MQVSGIPELLPWNAEEEHVMTIADCPPQRKFTEKEIIRRYMAAMVNEGANVLYDGIALKPSDIDVVKIHGYGFPRFRGGPMKYADTYGLKRMLNDLVEFGKENPSFWRPSPLILDLIKSGKNFEDLNN